MRAAAADNGKELWEFINDDVNSGLRPKIPMPVGNCIGGGLHSKPINGKRPDFQEFLLIPKEKSFARAITVNLRAYDLAKKLRRLSVSFIGISPSFRKCDIGRAWFMWLAPAFHQGPRPLLADSHARSSLIPSCNSLRCRVRERFHCRQRMTLSLRRNHPSRSSKTPRDSANWK